MHKSLLFFMVLFFAGIAVFGQNVVISGYVVNAKNNEHIPDVYVTVLPASRMEISNGYGFFSLSLQKSSKPFTLIFSNVSFQTDTLVLNISKDTLLTVHLVPGRMLSEVIINGNSVVPVEKSNKTGVLTIPMNQIDMLPALGGERDIIKAYQLMPGVQSGSEGSSSLLVRGGSNGQNLVLIDDVPVYYINHLGGFVSVFNSSALKSTRLYKGGFPARYGGRLSSVLDVRMKEGNNNKFSGSASIGLISAKAMAEGPIIKSKSSFLVSYRRFLYDLLMRPITRMTEENSSAGYYFQDFNLKLNHVFSPKNRLFLSLYFGDDKMISTYKEKGDNFTNHSKYTEQWGNFLTSLRWNHLFGKKIFGNFTFYFSRYRFRTEMNSQYSFNQSYQENINRFLTGIFDNGMKADFEYFLLPQYKIRLGLLTTYHTFVPNNTFFRVLNGNRTLVNKSFSGNVYHSWETAGYVENIVSVGEHLSINLGLRYSVYSVQSKWYTVPEPRLLFNWLIGKKNAVKLSFSKMHQNVHLLSNSGAGIPVDFWFPADTKTPPSASFQYSIGYATTLQGFALSAEGFYKTMKSLTTFKPGASYFGITKSFDQKIVTGGIGTVYGIDVLIQKSTGRLTGWLGYTWMKNYRQFNQINNGKPYPYKYDRRNDISLVVNYKISKSIDFSVTWVYGTGQALTLPVGKYYIPETFPDNTESVYFKEIYVYTDKNAFRAKDYHRMDIGINFHKKKKWGERIWNISIFNLYNRKNPYAYYFSGESSSLPGSTGAVHLVQQSLFPFTPSVSYTVNF